MKMDGRRSLSRRCYECAPVARDLRNSGIPTLELHCTSCGRPCVAVACWCELSYVIIPTRELGLSTRACTRSRCRRIEREKAA